MRLTRFSRVNRAIERALADGSSPVLYCHPWEFDDAHPSMPGLKIVERLVKFAGRRRTEKRLKVWLARHTFAPISTVTVSQTAMSEEDRSLKVNRLGEAA